MTDSSSSVRLAPLCAAAAAGRREELAALARTAIDAGCSAGLVREALLTLVPYCGVPRALDAFAAVRPVLGAAEAPPDDGACAARGRALFDRVYGRDAARVREALADLDVEAAEWVESFAYGTVLSRPGIPPSLRERIGIVLLAAQGQRSQLSGHVRGALNCGAAAEEVGAFLEAAAEFVAPPEMEFARQTLERVAARG